MEEQIEEIIEHVEDLGADLDDVRKERALKEMLEDLVYKVKEDTIDKAIELLDDM